MLAVSRKSSTGLACCFAWLSLGQAWPLTVPFDHRVGLNGVIVSVSQGSFVVELETADAADALAVAVCHAHHRETHARWAEAMKQGASA